MGCNFSLLLVFFRTFLICYTKNQNVFKLGFSSPFFYYLYYIFDIKYFDIKKCHNTGAYAVFTSKSYLKFYLKSVKNAWENGSICVVIYGICYSVEICVFVSKLEIRRLFALPHGTNIRW